SILRRRFCVFLAGVVRTDLDRAAGYHGRNGVLVHHLADLVAQQYHELVERLDDALQFDAIDEINRYRHALAAQGIQKGILQRLAFGHCYGLPIPVSRTVSLADSNGSAERYVFGRFHAVFMPKNNATAEAADSPQPGPRGSNTRASNSVRSQVVWRLAS